MAAAEPTRELAVANAAPSKIEMARTSYASACADVNEAKNWRTVFYLEFCCGRRARAKQDLDDALRLEAVGVGESFAKTVPGNE